VLPDAAGRAGEREPLTTRRFTAVQPQIRRVPGGGAEGGAPRRHPAPPHAVRRPARRCARPRHRACPSRPAPAGRDGGRHTRGGGHGRPDLLVPALTEMGVLPAQLDLRGADAERVRRLSVLDVLPAQAGVSRLVPVLAGPPSGLALSGCVTCRRSRGPEAGCDWVCRSIARRWTANRRVAGGIVRRLWQEELGPPRSGGSDG
jgi:hypothetical protein